MEQGPLWVVYMRVGVPAADRWEASWQGGLAGCLAGLCVRRYGGFSGAASTGLSCL